MCIRQCFQALFFGKSLGPFNHLGDIFCRNGYVILKRILCTAFHRGMERIVGCPHIALHGRCVAYQYIQAFHIFGKLCYGFHLLHDRIVVLTLKDCHEGRCDSLSVHFDREHGIAGDIAGKLDHVRIHVLYHCRCAACSDDRGRRLYAAFSIHERQKQYCVGLRLVHKLERQLADNGKRSLAADDRFISRKRRYAAVCKDDDCVENIVFRAAVLHCARAACVGRCVAAYRRGLFAGIGRIVQPVLLGFGLDILKQNARLYAQRALFFVIPKDLVHAFDRQDNSALYGH